MRHGCARAAVGRSIGQRLLANENGGLWITAWVAVLFVGLSLEQPGLLGGKLAHVRLDAAANGVALWNSKPGAVLQVLLAAAGDVSLTRLCPPAIPLWSSLPVFRPGSRCLQSPPRCAPRSPWPTETALLLR